MVTKHPKEGLVAVVPVAVFAIIVPDLFTKHGSQPNTFISQHLDGRFGCCIQVPAGVQTQTLRPSRSVADSNK